MPSFEQLLNISLGPLETAVTDWTQMITRLEQLRTEAGAMKTRADGAVWRGENASVTQPFIAKTAKEFGDAVTEAESVRDLLKDAGEKIKAAKADLKAVYEAPPAGITIYPNGVLSHRVHPDRRSKDSTEPVATQADFDALRQRLEGILNRAAEADELCSWGLRSLVKDHPNDFGSTDYNSIQDAKNARQAEKDVQDRKDADEAAKLFSRVDYLDDKERARLIELTERGKNSPAFSAELLTHLDFQGRKDQDALLLLAANLEGGGRDGQISGSETRLLNALSGNLATATAPGSPLGPVMGPVVGSHTPWTDRLLELARKGNDLPRQVPGSLPGGQQGYSALTKMIGAGDAKYDGGFLTSVGNSIRDWETHTKHPYEGMDKNWVGSQEDPVGGLMKAFSRNPEASTAYFDPAKSDNLDYFLKDRDWPGASVESKMPDDLVKTSARSQFGAALEAASTGREPNSPLHGVPARHDGAESAIFDRTIEYYGEQTKGVQSNMPAPLRHSMGNMIGDYASDVHQILGKNLEAPTEFSHLLLSLTREDLTRVIRATSDDPQAFATIRNAELEVINQKMHDFPAEAFRHGDDKSELRSWVRESSSVLGYLDGVRGDVIYDLGQAEKDVNAWNRMTAYHGIGALFTNMPMVGDMIQRGVDIGTTMHMNELNAAVDEATRKNMADHFSSGTRDMDTILESAAKQRGLTPAEMDRSIGEFEGQLQPLAEQWYASGIKGANGYMGERY
ncbi:DUF6571 family protein [Streptomyces sp. NBC_01205]|uniref:DUF6571 family protein n=1 Tax=Streptomyces sp. NBC_01205 TaxID=2903771 RepID=UPI002E15EBA2|nr:hypothetical protein OG573_08325 [Streptomyces sp. NBC_01205]